MGLLRTTFFLSGIFRQAEHNMDRSSARRAAKRNRKRARARAYWAQREAERTERIQAVSWAERKARIDATAERLYAESEAKFCQLHRPDNPSMRYWAHDCPVCQPAVLLSDADLNAVAALVAKGIPTQDVAEYVAGKTGLDVTTAKSIVLEALPSMWV